MELHLITLILLLSEGIPLGLSVRRKFYLIQQTKSWSDAQLYCRANHDDLATVETPNELIQIQTQVQKYMVTGRIWIGLWLDINSWHWTYQNVPLGSYNDWYLGTNPPQPENYGGDEACISIDLSGWWDLPCTYTRPVVCFDDRYSGNDRFFYYPIYMTFAAALTFCRQNHTDLANIRNSAENTYVQQMLTPVWSGGSSYIYAWIGLLRDSWKWSDQTSVATIPWLTGTPDNSEENENCGVVYNGWVDDRQCSILNKFFCHRVITGEQQVVRVKVTSNQDMNAAALRAQLQDQIAQKLRAHGIGNISIKWRERADESVFQKRPPPQVTNKICKV